MRGTTIFEGQTVRPLPWLSIASILLPACFMSLMYRAPAVWIALQRQRGAVGQGQWWRLVTPLLINSSGWGQFLMVSLGFVCIGSSLEQLFGWRRWLLLFIAGAGVGEIAAYAWSPTGGGTSNALCGLLGGLLVLRLCQGERMTVIASFYALGLITSLTGMALVAALGGTLISASVTATVLCGLLLQRFIALLRQDTASRTLAYMLASVILLEAMVLTGVQDEHGPSILAGACVGALLAWRDPQ